ncbi:MAG: hypothetical protein E7082_03475 [Bacteroidales bacterium]|nr:hypothetical protein [Bacteroidales bacterium]
MKNYKLIILLFAVLTLNSCATIRFGRTTTVTIETEHPGDVVDILAIGPKEAVDIQQVTLPYQYKVKNNNLPQRVDIISKNNLYDTFTIGAEHKGELIGTISKIFGWSTVGTAALINGVCLGTGYYDDMFAVATAGLLGTAGALFAIGYTAEGDIPDNKFYLTNSVPIDSTNVYKLQEWYLRQKALDDVYTLLSEGEYKLSKAKASYLIETEPTAELYYLRGISSYFLGEHKKAKSDLADALYRSNAEINPGLKNEILECISAVDQSIAIKKEERNRKWAQIAGTVLQAGAQAFSAYQQTEMIKYRQSHGISPSGVVVDPSKLSASDLNYLIDPNFTIQQTLSQEWQEYQQFCRYNKRPDGSDYSMDEFRAFQGAAIQHAKENGFDILAEQRRQAEEDKRWRKEQRQEDKSDWFARYGFDHNDNADSSSGSSVESGSTAYTASSQTFDSSNRSEIETSQQTDETNLDSKQQYKREAVSSEDYQRIKSVDLYYRDGDKARKMMRADLCKKGAYMYIKIGNIYYPRTSSNWQRYRNAIVYGHQQLYYND